MTFDGWIWCCIHERDHLREVVISSFHGVCHLQRPEMTDKLLKLTSRVLKVCKCHPHIPVLNTMTLIRLKYFSPQANKPFCTTEREQTRLRHEPTVKGNLLQHTSPSSVEIFFIPETFIIPDLVFKWTLSECQSSVYWQMHLRVPVHLLSCI